MTKEEFERKYQLPQELVLFYVEKMKKSEFDEEDAVLLGEMATLLRCDFSLDKAWKYSLLKREKEKHQCSCLLAQKRHGILQEIHQKERILSQLDCMRFELEHEKGLTS